MMVLWVSVANPRPVVLGKALQTREAVGGLDFWRTPPFLSFPTLALCLTQASNSQSPARLPGSPGEASLGKQAHV